MAHTCPECGMLCHCGGDIDDCEFDGTPEQDRCGHCDEDKPRPHDDDPTEAEDDRQFSEPIKQTTSAPNDQAERLPAKKL